MKVIALTPEQEAFLLHAVGFAVANWRSTSPALDASLMADIRRQMHNSYSTDEVVAIHRLNREHRRLMHEGRAD